MAQVEHALQRRKFAVDRCVLSSLLLPPVYKSVQ